MRAGTLRRMIGAVAVIALAALSPGQDPQAVGIESAALVAASAPSYRNAPIAGTLTGTSNPTTNYLPQAVKTSAPCPAGTQTIFGWLSSETVAGWTEIPAVDDQTFAEISTNGVVLSNNLLGIASGNGINLADGHYELGLVCFIDPYGDGAAQYNGGFTVSGSTVTWDVAGSQQTSVTMVADPADSVVVGRPVALTATVSPSGATGTVRFTRTTGTATVDVGTPVPVSGGVAALTVDDLPAGSHVLAATFVPGAATYQGSVSPGLPYVVLGAGQTATASTLLVSPSGSAAKGANVTLAASVEPAADGTVQFLDGPQPLATVPTTAGVAMFSTTGLAEGSHDLRAVFTPADSAAYAGSASEVVAFVIIDTGAGGGFLGFLTVQDEHGTTAQDIQVNASRPCPAEATSLTFAMTGPDAWTNGVALSGTGDFSGQKGAALITNIAQTAAQAGLIVVPGAYTLMIACREPTTGESHGIFAAPLWFYDSQHWLSKDPADVGIPTEVTLTVSPQYRGEIGGRITLTASVYPASVAGTMTFLADSNGSTTTLGSAKLASGRAAVTVTGLGLGLYYLTAAVTPDQASPFYRTSTSAEAMFAAVPIKPPKPPAAATITGTAKVGSSLTCKAAFGETVTSRSFRWTRDGAAISGQTAATHKVVAADRGHRLGCRASASNAGGTVYRDSATVRVP